MHLDSRKMINLSTTFTSGLKIIIDRLSGENREIKIVKSFKGVCYEGWGNENLYFIWKLIIDDGANKKVAQKAQICSLAC